MNWSSYIHFALALAFVLALIGGFAVVARRLGFGHAVRGPRSRRLAMVEVIALDAKRRLVLVRRDQVEHLLLISPTGERVIEAGIGPAAAGAAVSFADHLAGDATHSEEAVTCAAR